MTETHTAGAAVCPKATCANTMYSVTATSATAAKEANTAAGVMMMMMTRQRDVGNRESRRLVSRPRRARKTSFSLPPCKVEQPREGVSGARRGQTAGGRRRQSRLARFVRSRLEWYKPGSQISYKLVRPDLLAAARPEDQHAPQHAARPRRVPEPPRGLDPRHLPHEPLRLLRREVRGGHLILGRVGDLV